MLFITSVMFKFQSVMLDLGSIWFHDNDMCMVCVFIARAVVITQKWFKLAAFRCWLWCPLRGLGEKSFDKMKSAIFCAISFVYLNIYSTVEGGEATSKPSSETGNQFTGKTLYYSCLHGYASYFIEFIVFFPSWKLDFFSIQCIKKFKNKYGLCCHEYFWRKCIQA